MVSVLFLYKLMSLFLLTAKCSDPGEPDNGVKDGTDYRSGSNVTFSCNPPFDLVGSQMIICKDGQWSDSTPTCTSEHKHLLLVVKM